MIKKIVNTLIRLVIIAALLYVSFQFYRHITLSAKNMFDFELYKISILIHFIIFFCVGITLKFKLGLITAINKKDVKVNFVKLTAAVVLLLSLTLVILFYICVFLYILVVIALIAGVLFMESFEYETK